MDRVFHITVQGPVASIYLPIILKNSTFGSRRGIYKPNDTSNQEKPITSRVPQTHRITSVGDVDWVIFSLNEESKASFETSDSNDDTPIWLYDSSLNLIEFDNDDGSGLFSKKNNQNLNINLN